MNDMSERKKYLLEDWEKYPSFQDDYLIWGRFIQWNVCDSAVDNVKKDHKEVCNQSESLTLTIFKLGSKNFADNNFVTIHVSISQILFMNILIPGDLIAIDAQSQIILLAPHLVDFSAELKSQVISSLNQLKEQWKIWELWREYIKLVRTFFESKNFFEVSTPLIVCHPGPEPTLEPFSIDLKFNSQVYKKYLPTSPELNIKKLLSSGIMNAFEITKSFRNNEKTERHLPEFWILEWYRNTADLNSIKEDIKQLVSFLQKELALFLVQRNFLNFSISFPKKVQEISFSEALNQNYNFNFKPETSFKELVEFCNKEGLYYSGVETIEDLFSVITLEKVEPLIDPEQLVFLEKYPPYAAALAKKNKEGWAARFEAYWKGYELANAFHELNDYEEQKLRFHSDNLLKKKYGQELIPEDEVFLDLLKKGAPPAAGVALGLERLFMALTGIRDIDKIPMNLPQ